MFVVMLCMFITASISAQDNLVDTLIYDVKGNCGSCKARIEAAAIFSDGVMKASYATELEKLTVRVHVPTYNEVGLHENIAAVGHDTNLAKSKRKVYNALPACCKYRDRKPKEEEAITSPYDFPEVGGSGINPKDHQHGEDMVCGMIYEEDELGNLEPLIGATVSWKGTANGTSTDLDGHFELKKHPVISEVVISYVSYQADTLSMKDKQMVSVVLSNAIDLEEVKVVHRRKTTEVSYLNPIKLQNIGEKELLKAACCSVAESFETTPAVDVTFTDAVTGTRKIQMLGLEGPYIQVMRENMPYIRGAAAAYGLTYTPGTYLQGIQLNLGAGSVVNGFESFTGQINLELKKPENMEKLYANLYANEGGRVEANLNLKHEVSEKWHAGTLLHTKYNRIERDRNNDNFLDGALSTQFIGLHRWKYFGDNGLRIQFGLKGTYIDNIAGQLGFKDVLDDETISLWGANVLTKRIEGWTKLGKIFEDNPFKSIAVQLSGSYHTQDGIYGLKTYNVDQESFYSNFIFQNIINDSSHKYKTGLSFQYDKFEELVLVTPFNRKEIIPGAFFEYSYSFLDKFNAILGIRADHHNNYGFFYTPRLHMRYAPIETLVFRLGAGRAQRTASVFSENTGMFASNRRISLTPGPNMDNPYYLNPEVAWNFGLNMSTSIKIADRDAIFGLDYYYTYFIDQVIVDYDLNATSVSIYNLDGKSYSGSFQAQLDYELFTNFDIRLAYRNNNVKTKYVEGLLQKPLISKQRAFLNLAYEIPKSWNFDFTLNWQDTKRIPGTESNPVEYQIDSQSPAFFVANTQISKHLGEFEIYLGAENLFDYRQDDPIISVENPFGEYFDSSLIWGPIFGRNVYTGLRWKIK